jgi:hypothetical protein
MPSAHRRYAFWTPARLLTAAEKIGPSTVALCEAIIRAKPHPEQGFRSCLGILSLARLRCGTSRGRMPARDQYRRDELPVHRFDPQAWPRQGLSGRERLRCRSATAISAARAITTDLQEGDIMLVNHSHERLIALRLSERSALTANCGHDGQRKSVAHMSTAATAADPNQAISISKRSSHRHRQELDCLRAWPQGLPR